jgi:hypothetical protein
MPIFTLIAWISLGIAFLCALVIAIDEIGHPQQMWIMNIVWPVTALYLSVFALWGYFRIGRGMAKNAMQGMSHEVSKGQIQQQDNTKGWKTSRDPNWRQTAISDTHCGDIVAEFSLFAPGWTLFGKALYAEYAGDLLLAWLFGIAFQYFAIAPMRNLSLARKARQKLGPEALCPNWPEGLKGELRNRDPACEDRVRVSKPGLCLQNCCEFKQV